MKPLLTPEQMYALEKQHFDHGLPTLTAMENAASAFLRELILFAGPLAGKTVCVACGSGNNAGDGYAIARLAAQEGACVSIVALTPIEKLRGDALINARRSVVEMRIPCLANSLPAVRPDIWVDALFGIGLNRPIPDSIQPVISLMENHRAQGSIVCSVDVPSGLNAETGRIEGMAVSADLTVTFQYAKTSHYLLDGPDATGRLIIADIGMNRFPPEECMRLVEPGDPSVSFRKRRHNTHKGTWGHLIVIAGSFGMAGAAAYTAHAALRSGAGLVTIACPRSIVPVLQTILPAAMCIPLPEADGAIGPEAVPVIREALRGKTAVAIGPGLSRKADPGVLRAVLESDLPAVIDADALNLLAANPSLQSLLNSRHVLTPHPGEAARLCPACSSLPHRDIRLLHALHATVLLKGAASIIAGKEFTVSASGSPGMAVGGSGDVLTGIIGALLAAGVDPEQAAWSGSEIHGRCGELAEEKTGCISMNASDLIDMLPSAIRQITG